MNQLEVLRESLGQCDEIILDALLMRNRIVEDIMAYKEANDIPILLAGAGSKAERMAGTENGVQTSQSRSGRCF